jgi:hypothetical protein
MLRGASRCLTSRALGIGFCAPFSQVARWSARPVVNSGSVHLAGARFPNVPPFKAAETLKWPLGEEGGLGHHPPPFF